MNTNGLVSLYVVQKNDTIDSICQKFQISKRIFYRYNKIMKYIPLTPNSPVYIVYFKKEQILNIDLDNNDISISLNSIAYLLKEGIISSLYLENNLPYIKQALEKEYSSILTSLSINENNKILINSSLLIITDKLFNIKNIILSKNKDLLYKEEKELKNLINDFVNNIKTISSSINKELLNDTLDKISSLYQTLIIKFMLKRYDETYTIFNDILNQFVTLNKIIITN